jgi:hypothetical protein
MKVSIFKFFAIGIIFSSISCDDILEEDITNDIVHAVYPSEGAVIESNVVNFQWDNLDGARDYRLQVYNLSQVKVHDTLVNANSVSLPMSEGSYQWRIRGENAGYMSSYSFPIYFEVDESLDLTNQQILLSSPINNFTTNLNNFTLSWDDLAAADSYSIEIVNNSTGSTIVYQQSDIISTNIALNNTIIMQDGNYSWKVKGVNTSSQTVFSSRSFSIDTNNPNQPQNSLPANNSMQNLNQTINFTWTIPSDSGLIQSSISYVIEFALDSSFSSIIQSSNVTGTTFSQIFTSSGDYYWRIVAKDAAGNIGIPSTSFKITFN